MHSKPYVLLAEDNQNDAYLTQTMVSRVTQNLDVAIVADGADLLKFLRRQDPHAHLPERNPLFILLDIKMPRLGGLEALQEIRKDQKLRSIIVVMFTSSREESDIQASYELGANGYVIKPVNYKKFQETINKMLDYWLNVNAPPGGMQVMFNSDISSN
jgi:CheY-like chemotaxis protein